MKRKDEGSNPSGHNCIRFFIANCVLIKEKSL